MTRAGAFASINADATPVDSPKRDRWCGWYRDDDCRLQPRAADAPHDFTARLRRLTCARADRRRDHAPAARDRAGRERARPGTPLGLRVGLRHLARHPATALRRAARE